MSDTVNTTANYEFRNNLELQLQASTSLLWDATEEQDCTGSEKETVKDLIGKTKPQEADERHGDLKQTNVNHDRVWITKPNELYFNEYVDGADQLSTKIGLTGAYTMAGMATIHRAWDDRILQGMYGPILSGKDGTVLTPFPSSMVVPVTVGGASGAMRFNTAKLRQANKMLKQGYAMQPGDKKYMIIDAEQNDDLLSEVPVTSDDFKGAFGGKVDEDGNVTNLLGWTFIHMELRNTDYLVAEAGLTVDANGYTRNPFWVKSGVRKGVWTKVRTAIKDQPSKVDTRSVFAGTTVGATRTQAGKVGIILNSEA